MRHNLVHLTADQQIGSHAEPDLDVLLLPLPPIRRARRARH
ncbi:hypothetical protein [Streptacidiphilus monticola]|uniref:Uncharacterized protein n=1 Tax=Streptacidiphilus monticola TaxID=2161674 RepID=A0ABW1FYE7_9ACTN